MNWKFLRLLRFDQYQHLDLVTGNRKRWTSKQEKAIIVQLEGPRYKGMQGRHSGWKIKVLTAM